MRVGRWQQEQEQEQSPAGCHKGHEAARGPWRARRAAGSRRDTAGRDASTGARCGGLRCAGRGSQA